MSDYTAEIIIKNKTEFTKYAEDILKKYNIKTPIDADDVPEDILSEIYSFPFEFEQRSIE